MPKLRKFVGAIDWVGRADVAHTIFLTAKVWIPATTAGVLAMVAAAADPANLSYTAVLLAALAAFVLIAILAMVILAIVMIWRALRTKGGANEPPIPDVRAESVTNPDEETKRLAGVVNALKERALKYDFRLPTGADDPFLPHYRDVEGSAHPLWADDEAGRLRSEFLHWITIIGTRHEVPTTADDFRESRNELTKFARQLISKLLGQIV